MLLTFCIVKGLTRDVVCCCIWLGSSVVIRVSGCCPWLGLSDVVHGSDYCLCRVGVHVFYDSGCCPWPGLFPVLVHGSGCCSLLYLIRVVLRCCPWLGLLSLVARDLDCCPWLALLSVLSMTRAAVCFVHDSGWCPFVIDDSCCCPWLGLLSFVAPDPACCPRAAWLQWKAIDDHRLCFKSLLLKLEKHWRSKQVNAWSLAFNSQQISGIHVENTQKQESEMQK